MTRRIRGLTATALASFVLAASAEPAGPPPTTGVIRPVAVTEPVAGDPDDPAIWRHPARPSHSLILGTDKGGALYVFDLAGHIVQRIPMRRPNNVDVETGFRLGGKVTDIAVVTERLARRLRIFRIDPLARRLVDVTGPRTTVFAGEPGERGAPMGVALYRRPRDGAVFAIVSRKEGPREGYLWQYRLEPDSRGRVNLTRVRQFGAFSGSGEIEALAVDDEAGRVYYADEGACIRAYGADPDGAHANRQIAAFGTSGYRGDREGIAILGASAGSGWVLCTDQVSEDSRCIAYRRDVQRRLPADGAIPVALLSTGCDSTDGLDASSADFGPGLAGGIIVAMNSRDRNFAIFRAPDLIRVVRR